ncbi:universal stress protein [Asticcacaulis tiandongensis]|uniref:universal stress protein n=1 Tax=Asticcacaulis tiandongensis TaxID=2565365 RepID=UPI00112D6495|nr:universal stress protein [Asticcacaulis tiandongensis]
MSVRKFLIVADDSAQFNAALKFASGRAKNTGGVVALLRVLEPSDFSQWVGVRDEIEREERAEAETLMAELANVAAVRSGRPAEIIIKTGGLKESIREVIDEDPDIKIIVLAATHHNRDIGPLAALLVREGMVSLRGKRTVPVTVVPGDLSDAEIMDLV